MFCVFIKKLNEFDLDIHGDILPEAMSLKQQTEMNLMEYSPEDDKATLVHTGEAEPLSLFAECQFYFLCFSMFAAAKILLYLAWYNLHEGTSL